MLQVQLLAAGSFFADLYRLQSLLVDLYTKLNLQIFTVLPASSQAIIKT